MILTKGRTLKNTNLIDRDEENDFNIHRTKSVERKNNWTDIELLCGRSFEYDTVEDYNNEKTESAVTCPQCLKMMEELK